MSTEELKNRARKIIGAFMPDSVTNEEVGGLILDLINHFEGQISSEEGGGSEEGGMWITEEEARILFNTLIEKWYPYWFDQRLRTSDSVSFNSLKVTNNLSSNTATIEDNIQSKTLNATESIKTPQVTTNKISSERFTSGPLGEGYRIDENGNAEVNNLTVRGQFSVFEFIRQQVKAVGGNILATSGDTKIVQVEETAGEYKCYFNNEQRTIPNPFVAGDLVIHQVFNGQAMKRYWRLVTGTGNDYFLLSKTDCEAGSGIPAVDDDVIQLGNKTDASRQNAIIISSYGNSTPYIAFYTGINSYSLAGKEVMRSGNLAGIVDPDFGQLRGFGMYSKDVYLKGVFKLLSGKTVEETISGVESNLSSSISGVENSLSNSIIGVENSLSGSIAGVQNNLNNLQIGAQNLISKKMMLKWNENIGHTATWGIDDDGIFLSINPGALYIGTSTSAQNPIFDIDFKPDTQYVLSVEWKTATTEATLKTGLIIFIYYTDGTSDSIYFKNNVTSKTRVDLVSEKNKTISKISASYGYSIYARIYNISLTEGNKPLGGFPVATEDQRGASNINLANNSEEAIVTAPATTTYAHCKLPVPEIKPNTVYYVNWEKVENLAGNPSKYTARLFATSLSESLSSINNYEKGGVIITRVDIAVQPGYLLLYAGAAGETQGNSVKFSKIMLVEGSLPPAVWVPSVADQNARIAAAKAAADTAQSAANNAQQAALTANAMLADIASDNKLTAQEKQQAKKEWDIIYGEKPNIVTQGQTYGISTTNYVSTYDALNTYLTPLLANLSTTSDITGTTFRNKFKAYYDARTLLLKAVSDKAKLLADNAQNAANNAQNTANNAQNEIVKVTKSLTDLTVETGKIQGTVEQTVSAVALNKYYALAQSWSSGKSLNTDPAFKTGVNKLSAYNNAGNNNTTLLRVAKLTDSPISDSDYNIRIRNIGPAAPELGGFTFYTQSRANAIFVYRIIAKIPVGYRINIGSNRIGTGGVLKFATPVEGTGKWKEYFLVAMCGPSGTFSTTGFFYLIGPAGTSASPVDWYLAYAGAFDITQSAGMAEQAKDEAVVLAKEYTGAQITVLNNTISGLVKKETYDANNALIKQDFAKLQLTADSLTTSVSSLKDGRTLVSYINQTSDTIKIHAEHIELDGAITANGNVEIKNGKLIAKDAQIEGTIIAKSGKFTGEVIATSGSFTGEIYSTKGRIGGFEIANGRIGSEITVSEKSGGLTMTNNFIRVGDTIGYIMVGNNVIPATAGPRTAVARIVNNRPNKEYMSINYGMDIETSGGTRNYGVHSNAPLRAPAFIDTTIDHIDFLNTPVENYIIDLAQYSVFSLYSTVSKTISLPSEITLADRFGVTTLPSTFGRVFTLIARQGTKNITIQNLYNNNHSLVNITMVEGDVMIILVTKYPTFHYKILSRYD